MRPTTRQAYKFFHEGTKVLSRIEGNGVQIDVGYLDRTIKRVSDEIDRKTEALRESKVYAKWKKRFGRKANLDSTPQLADVLFKDMGFEPTEFTEKTKDLDEHQRRHKTDEYSLRNIDHPFIKDFFSVRKLKKVLGTYLKGVRREVTPTGLLHPSYNLAGGQTDDQKGGAASYRGSSSNPNFQNIPIRNKVMGGLIRPCFVARKGRRLVERDFSGIEVRVSACYNKDPNLIRYINDKSTDMHRDEACELFILKPDQVVKGTTRDASKNMWVFPQFYGSVWFQCAPPIWEAMDRRDFRVGESGITIREHLRRHGITELGECDPEKGEPGKGTFARHLMQAEKKLWNDRFPVYTKWKKDFYNRYLERGYFDLYTGFRCAGLFRRNQVINFPVQGAAFHCLLWTLIEIQKEIDRRRMRTLLVGEIHDSFFGDCPEDEVQEYLDLTGEIAEERLPKAWDWINVPIETEVDVVPAGKSWYDKEQWVRNAKGVWEAKA
jgi:DNA polymerase-1